MKTTRSERDYAYGAAVLTLRTKIGLTQTKLANRLGIARLAVCRWEAGSAYPKPEHLKALIALAVQYQAFPTGHESEEIRQLWKIAHQKMLLDEDWLCTLLEHSSSPQDKETVGVVPCVDPEPPPSAHPLSPLPSMPSVEDGTSSATPTTSQPLESGTTGVPWPGVEDELVQADGSVQRNGSVKGDGSAQRNELVQGDGSVQGTIPTVGKRGGRRRLLIPILIALVLVTIIGSERFFFKRDVTLQRRHTRLTRPPLTLGISLGRAHSHSLILSAKRKGNGRAVLEARASLSEELITSAHSNRSILSVGVLLMTYSVISRSRYN